MSDQRLKMADGTSWPRPSRGTDDGFGIGHRLRYADPSTLTRSDLLEAASIVDAYGCLVETPAAARVLPALRRAIRERRGRKEER